MAKGIELHIVERELSVQSKLTENWFVATGAKGRKQFNVVAHLGKRPGEIEVKWKTKGGSYTSEYYSFQQTKEAVERYNQIDV